MKKIGIVLILILTSVLITVYQINIIKEQTLQTYKEVVVVNKAVNTGEILKLEDLSYGKVNTAWFTSAYLVNFEEAIGKTVSIDLLQNCILQKSMLVSTQDVICVSDQDHALTSLKLLPEEALCWTIQKGEVFLLYHINGVFEETELGEIMIKEIYDSNVEEGTHIGLPSYILIESQKEIVEEIVKLRDTGRFEIVRVPSN